MRISLKTLWLGLFLTACATPGVRRQQSFFQAVELARAGKLEASREAFDVACSMNSSAACQRLGDKVDPAFPLAIMQGATDESATEVIVLVPPGQSAEMFLWDTVRDRLVEPLLVNPTALPADQGRLVQLRFEGLVSGVNYNLQVVGGSGELLDRRTLQTLDVSKNAIRFAVASCMLDSHPAQKPMWKDLLSHDPEMIVLIGDNVYADSPGVPATPEILWKRYTQTRGTLELFKSPKLVPIFATWDDHDYGANDGDASFEYKAAAKQVFQAFFGGAQYPGTFDRGPGVSSRLNAFRQRFFFLDDRSFRDGATHYGADQEAWLFTEVFADAPVWLISGNQFFGGYHKFESFQGKHPESFTRFLRRLKNAPAPVAFISGDRHLTEVMAIPKEVLGYPTVEVTSSSIHSSVYPDAWKDAPNPLQVEGVSGVNNYVIIDSDSRVPWKISVRAYGPDKLRLYSRSFEVSR